MLSESSVDRELEAVNSEFEGRRYSDARRIFQIEKMTCDPQHSFSKSFSGNTESLKITPTLHGINIRQVLHDFYENEYSANLMSLAVIGNRK